MLRLALTAPIPPSHSHHHPHLNPKSLTLTPPRRRPSPSVALSSLKIPFSSSPILDIKPFAQSQWQPILKGWILSAASVYCLSASIPRIGRLPSLLAAGPGSDKLAREGLILAALACARSATSYLQQALLWEAALGSAYEIRSHVFDRVLERDLGFFEGSDGVPAGDVAHRITAEAADVADTLYALLNTIVPNALQLLVVAAQMVKLSPALSLISALVIPCMSLVVAYLGERLRKISRKAQLSAAHSEFRFRVKGFRRWMTRLLLTVTNQPPNELQHIF